MVSLCLSVPILLRILEVFPYLPKSISEELHNLFLSLMADKMFKKHLAIAYAEGYMVFTKAYGEGYGTIDNSIFSLAVQFLNRDFLVAEIVDNHRFFENICLSIENMLLSTLKNENGKSENGENSENGDNGYFGSDDIENGNDENGDKRDSTGGGESSRSRKEIMKSEILLKSPVLTHRRYNPMFCDLKVRTFCP